MTLTIFVHSLSLSLLLDDDDDYPTTVEEKRIFGSWNGSSKVSRSIARSERDTQQDTPTHVEEPTTTVSSDEPLTRVCRGGPVGGWLPLRAGSVFCSRAKSEEKKTNY